MKELVFQRVCSMLCMLGAQVLGQQIPSAQRAYEEGLRLEGEGRHEQAARKFQEAIDINPEFSDAYSQFAASELHAGKTQEAIKACPPTWMNARYVLVTRSKCGRSQLFLNPSRVADSP